MPFEVIWPARGTYQGVRTLRFTGSPDGSEATVVLSNAILTVTHRGVIDKKHPALSPTDDGMPAEIKRRLQLIKREEVLAHRQQLDQDEELITRITQAVPICTTIAVGHQLRLRPLIPSCRVKFIELGVVRDWRIHNL